MPHNLLASTADLSVYGVLGISEIIAELASSPDATLRAYTRPWAFIKNEPRGLWSKIVEVERFDSATDRLNPRMELANTLGSLDFFHVITATGIIAVRNGTTLLAGERPLHWRLHGPRFGAGENTLPDAD